MQKSIARAALFGGAIILGAQPGWAQSSSGSFTINGDTIVYEISGSGPPMLLIHGFPLASALFNDQRTYFSKSYTVITPDLPGFGRSSTTNSAQTIGNYAMEMYGLLDTLHIGTAIIGGHSMGGQVVLDMYRKQPGRFRGMILFDTNPKAASMIEMAQWPAFARMAEKFGPASIAPPVVAVMVTGDSIAKQPVLQSDITAEVIAAEPVGVAGGANALVTRLNYSSLLGTIAVPTLVIVGRDDPVYPVPVSQALAAAIPGATLAILPGVAHASMLQNGQAVDDAMTAWLAGVP